MKTVFIFLLTASTLFAQQKISFDIDNDKILDTVSLAKTAAGFQINYSLSTENKSFNTKIISYGQNISIAAKNNILILDCNFMRAESTFKFRYNVVLKKVILIGYDYLNYGGATHDGSGNLSYNLITRAYIGKWNYFDTKKQKLIAFPVIKKKLPAQKYYLTDFSDDQIDKITDHLHALLPKSIQ